ncbi:hypothetical protein ABZP36_019566 [Zizania latifolia]
MAAAAAAACGNLVLPFSDADDQPRRVQGEEEQPANRPKLGIPIHTHHISGCSVSSYPNSLARRDFLLRNYNPKDGHRAKPIRL